MIKQRKIFSQLERNRALGRGKHKASKKIKKLTTGTTQTINLFNQELIAELMDYFHINFFALDTKGNYLYRNDTLSDIVGKKTTKVVDPKAWAVSKRIMESKKRQIVEEEYEGTWYLSIKAPLLNHAEEVTGLIGIGIDITDRKRVELELKKAKEEIEAANARIKTMAGSIAHELRTPLGTIGMNLGCVENLLDKLPDDDREIAAESFQEIRKELESASTIINMLLMNIREQLDWQKEKMETCSINNCIEEALRRYPFVEDQRSKVSWQKGQDFSFKGNAIFMQHVIFNLLKNALLQIDKAGKGEITIWTEKETDGFSLHFKDTASGVPKDILPHLFERFFSRTKNGTGLGLAFCKMVIESFGGTISCHSEEGKYMEFIIHFSR